uniref:Uncharacterized protein n=1 Tax=Ascaris lumbricoides TaxID=6252 RepID=A0A0M3I5A5_ASCLU
MVSSEGADLWYSHRKTTNRQFDADEMSAERGVDGWSSRIPIPTDPPLAGIQQLSGALGGQKKLMASMAF